jgi:hypothetical protein
MTAKKHFTIDCSADTHTRFLTFKAKHNATHGEALSLLLQHYDQPAVVEPTPVTPNALIQLLDYSPEELDEIDAALAHEYNDVWHLLKTGLLAQVRRATSFGIANGQRDINDPSQRMRVKGAGYVKVAETVQHLMQANRDALTQGRSQWDIVYLGKVLVARASGCHQLTVDQYWTQHGAEIDQHNADNGFTSARAGALHNRRRIKYFKELQAKMAKSNDHRGGTKELDAATAVENEEENPEKC